MRKNRLLLTVAAITALPAMALLTANRNAIGRGPVFGKEFQNPPAETRTEKEPETKAGVTADPRDASPHLNAAPESTELPPIVASVYDYSTGMIGMYRLPELSGGEMEAVSQISSYYGGTLDGNRYYACHDG